MIVYIDPSNAPLKGVPQRLLPKAVAQFAEAAESYGLKPVPTPGLPSDAVRVDTRGVKNAAHLQEWLESINAIVVDVEASDVPALYSHKVTPESLALFRHFPSEQFSQLAVEDLNSKIRESFFMGYDGSDIDDSDIGLLQQEDIVKDLRKAGINVPDATGLDQWYEMQKPKPVEVSDEFRDTANNPFHMPDDMGLI